VDARCGGAVAGGGFIIKVGLFFVDDASAIGFEVLAIEADVISSSSSTNQGLAAKPLLESAIERFFITQPAVLTNFRKFIVKSRKLNIEAGAKDRVPAQDHRILSSLAVWHLSAGYTGQLSFRLVPDYDCNDNGQQRKRPAFHRMGIRIAAVVMSTSFLLGESGLSSI
jgi:hypothetical protein